MEVSILFPSEPSKVPLLLAVTNKCTKLLFINNKNLINKGAKAIAIPPKHNLVRLSFASFFCCCKLSISAFAICLPSLKILTFAFIRCGLSCRYHSLFFVSMHIVTGPSLSNSTSIIAPNSPVPIGFPKADVSNSQKRL